MSDTAQIIGVGAIMLLMLLALYGIVYKEELGKPIWLMANAILIGMVIF